MAIGGISLALQLTMSVHLDSWNTHDVPLWAFCHTQGFILTLHVPLHQWYFLCGRMHGMAHAVSDEVVDAETDCHLLSGGIWTCLVQTWKWMRMKSLLLACTEQQQPPCAVAALFVHARLQTLINFPDWAEPLLMKRLILRAGGMFHHLVHSCDSGIP